MALRQRVFRQRRLAPQWGFSATPFIAPNEETVLDAKETKVRLMQVAALMADGITIAGTIPAGPTVTDPAVQKVVQLRVKLLEEFYPYVLAAHQGNGTNSDGTPNAFTDPGSPVPIPPAPPPAQAPKP